MKKFIHIDMDCFYAAIEMRDNPHLKSYPIAVGGSPRERGVLCTCNYLARQYGIHSAMATAHAKKLCPNLVVIPPNMEKYKESSESIMQIFSEFTDLVEPLSLDEAYLDVTDNQDFNSSATLIAKEIRRCILKKEKLTASAGIAPNKFLAKVASDWRKPNGVFTITPKQTDNFVRDLPINKIFGVGKVTAKKLNDMNIYACGDLQKISKESLIASFGAHGSQLYELCRGIDHREIDTNRIRKSLSVEKTFSIDFRPEKCSPFIDKLYEELTRRLKAKEDRAIANQFVKIKFDNFQLTTVEHRTQEMDKALFKELFYVGSKRYQKLIRLIGIGVKFADDTAGNLLENQLNLFKC